MSSISGERSRLKKDAIPSVFNFQNKPSASAVSRTERGKKRKQQDEEGGHFDIDNVQDEVIVPNTPLTEDIEEDVSPNVNASIQCQLLTDQKYSINMFISKPKAIQYYTGFDDYDHFLMFFTALGEAAYHLKYECLLLDPKDQLFLTLMKLRQAKEDFELSLLFNISETTISTIVVTWIIFLYFQLKEIDFWPSKELVQEYMPEDFGKKFGATRVILDATEIPIMKPSNVISQSVTFSTYKNKNTLKTMVGCTPRGLISYVSDAYGGSTSDRQIIERSELMKSKNMFSKKDTIMADRGIMVQDLFAQDDIHVNTPTMLKGKSQLEPEEVVKDRRIASKRIHIERVIGLSKRFKILTVPLPPSKLSIGSRIIFVCFAISNFRKCIVGYMA